MTLPAISVVIPTWNGLPLIKKYLTGILNSLDSYQGQTEVIVVDDGSIDRTTDVLHYFYPEVTVVTSLKNSGFGSACNQGVAAANHNLVLLLNNDVILNPQTVPTLIDEYLNLDDPFSLSPATYLVSEHHSDQRLFSSHIYYRYCNGQFQQVWGVSEGVSLTSGTSETLYITGAVAVIDRTKFLELEGFDPLYGRAYWEDIDLCSRARGRGWKSYCTTNASAGHLVSASSGEQSYFKQYQMTRNNIIYNLLYLPDDYLRIFTESVFEYLQSSKPVNPHFDLNSRLLQDIRLYLDSINAKRKSLQPLSNCLPERLIRDTSYHGWSAPILMAD